MTTLKDIGSFEKSEQEIHSELPRDSSKIEESIRTDVKNIVDHSLEFVEVPGMKIARLPLGPKKEHLDGMVQAGKLDVENIFVGEIVWKGVETNEEVPQVFGYTIANDEELARVITDEKALDDARKEVEITGTFPIIYFLNEKARFAYAAYLGGRIPSQEEQKNFWNKLSGVTVLEKARNASIPFSGGFFGNNIGVDYVGIFAFLVSSSKDYFNMGLRLARYDRSDDEIDERRYGSSGFQSFLVVFE